MGPDNFESGNTRSVSARHFLVEPRARSAPVAFDSIQRDLQHLGRLFETQASKEAQQTGLRPRKIYLESRSSDRKSQLTIHVADRRWPTQRRPVYKLHQFSQASMNSLGPVLFSSAPTTTPGGKP